MAKERDTKKAAKTRPTGKSNSAKAKISENVENLIRLNKLQGTILIHLKRQIKQI